MKCRYCGKQLKKDAEFCGSCGRPVSHRHILRRVLAIIGILIVLNLVVFIVVAIQAKNEYERISSEQYEFDEEVIEEIPALSSKSIPTVVELASLLDERGFGEAELYANYDMSGNLLEQVPLDKKSTEAYPLYVFSYVDSNDNRWYVYVCNGDFEADPVFASESLNGFFVLVESDYLSAYDAYSNAFLRTKPDKSEATIKRIERIDAEALDSLSSVELLEAL